ncbi:hypothetical protein KR038_007546 [Drosophila bunnanda]|nr:hypothetical protein KR038_007546 [Drosophila bunnanda]
MYTRSSNIEPKKSLDLTGFRLIVEARDEANNIGEFLSRTGSSTYKLRVQRYPKDDADVSKHPSYNFLNYDLTCYVRYRAANKKYSKQFRREMANFIANQPNKLEEYYLKR